ncbi:MAG TPA: PAS domain-containing protein [Stellaceae bacterium]|nr:PAS domain-containing protein [Stellaceae bacterium]
MPATAHHKIRKLYDYWRGIAASAGRLPGRRHIDPLDIPTLLENIWLLDVVGAPPQFRFRLIGSALQRMGIPGKVGDFVDQLLPTGGDDPVMEDFRRAARDRVPVWFRGKARVPHTTEMFELERLYLPLAADGSTVDMLLCMTVFYTLGGVDI